MTAAEVMSTFAAHGDLSSLFKVTGRIYFWQHPHYPCLHLLFDVLSNVQHVTSLCVALFEEMGLAAGAAKL